MREIRRKPKEGKNGCTGDIDQSVLKIIFDEEDSIDARVWFKDIGKAILEREFPKNTNFFISSRRISVVPRSKWFPNDPNRYTYL